MRLEMEPDFEVVGEAGDGPSALDAALDTRPDVILMDVAMPGRDGIAVTRDLQDAAPECVVIVVSMQDDRATRSRAIAAGAVAFVAKQDIDAELTTAIRAAAAGTRPVRRLSGWIGDLPPTDDAQEEGQTV